MTKIRKQEDWLDWSKYAMITRFCGQWANEIPSIEDLIGKSPFQIPDKKQEDNLSKILLWKEWAKETGLMCGGDI